METLTNAINSHVGMLQRGIENTTDEIFEYYLPNGDRVERIWCRNEPVFKHWMKFILPEIKETRHDECTL